MGLSRRAVTFQTAAALSARLIWLSIAVRQVSLSAELANGSSNAGTKKRRLTRAPYRTEAATRTASAPDTRATTKAGGGPVIASNALIASSGAVGHAGRPAVSPSLPSAQSKTVGAAPEIPLRPRMQVSPTGSAIAERLRLDACIDHRDRATPLLGDRYRRGPARASGPLLRCQDPTAATYTAVVVGCANQRPSRFGEPGMYRSHRRSDPCEALAKPCREPAGTGSPRPSLPTSHRTSHPGDEQRLEWQARPKRCGSAWDPWKVVGVHRHVDVRGEHRD